MILNTASFLGLINPSLRERLEMSDYILDVLSRYVRLIRGLLPYSIKKCRKHWEISSKSYIFETQMIK